MIDRIVPHTEFLWGSTRTPSGRCVVSCPDQPVASLADLLNKRVIVSGIFYPELEN